MNTLTFKRTAVVVAGFLFITFGSLAYAQSFVPTARATGTPTDLKRSATVLDEDLKTLETKYCTTGGFFSIGQTKTYFQLGLGWITAPYSYTGSTSRYKSFDCVKKDANTFEVSVGLPTDYNSSACSGKCTFVGAPTTGEANKNRITLSVCPVGYKREGSYVVLCGKTPAQVKRELDEKCIPDTGGSTVDTPRKMCDPVPVCKENSTRNETVYNFSTGKCENPAATCPEETARPSTGGACTCTDAKKILDAVTQKCVLNECSATEPEKCPQGTTCNVSSNKCVPATCDGTTCSPGQICGNSSLYQCKWCPQGTKPNPAKNDCIKDETSPVPTPTPQQCSATSFCVEGQYCTAGNTCEACGSRGYNSSTKKCQCDVGVAYNGTSCGFTQPPPVTNESCVKPVGGVKNSAGACVCPSGTTHIEPIDSCRTQIQITQSEQLQQQCKQAGRKWEGNSCSPQCLEQGYVLNGTNCVQSQGCQQQGGQIQNGICMFPNPNNNNNQNQQKAQQCVQKGGTWANNECLPGTPNAQQPKPTPQQQQQAAQQAAQQQQQQAQQQCLAQGGQWNGQQCLPPAFNPYTSPYYNQQTAQKPACNYFGASLTEVPFGETVDLSWEITGASTISLDTSPKSSTKYVKGDASSQANSTLGTITNSINSPLIQPSAPQSTIIGATVKPSKKGTLTVRLKVNNLLQNSDPCKPIKLKVVDPAEVSAIETEDTSQNYSATANEQVSQSYLDQGVSNNSSGIGEEVELASDIARQKREAAAEVQRNNAEAKPEVTKATYENLCALFGIGCGGGEETAALSNPVETVARGSASTTTPVERLTINPGDVGVDVPNVGSEDGAQAQGGFTTTTQTVYQDGGTTVVAYDPQQATDNAVAGYVQDNAKYAADGIAPQATSNGQLKQEAVTEDTTETKKVGVFSRMWGWFMNLIGFGPEQV
ncbi:MAG: hypothetical protein WAX38_03270 [Minisyncoccia bacterium]